MGCTVASLRATMSYSEFVEWQGYYQIEPWDELRADWRSGLVAAVLANVNRKKDSKTYKPDDFMPKFTGPKDDADDWRVMQDRIRLAGAMAGAMNKSKKKTEDT